MSKGSGLKKPGFKIWLCIPFCCCCLIAKSCRTLATPWTVARQAPLPIGFPRQEYWSGLPFPSPGNLPDPGIQPMSPALAGEFLTTESPEKPTAKEFQL